MPPSALEPPHCRRQARRGFDPWIFSGGLGYRLKLFGARARASRDSAEI